LPDGSTNIQRSGGEYFNIMPVWEWDKIPGITSRDFKEDQPIISQWGETGSTAFTGGVSDGLYGATCYDMDYNEVKAKKAWFFFDKEVVCLGAGINSSAEENIVTSINQCWLGGKIKAFAKEKTQNVKNNFETNFPNWVWHDSIGYFFYQPVNVLLSAQKQKGNWSRINSSQPKEEVEGNVFKLWINHGSKPVENSYAYSVVPGITFSDMEQYQPGEIAVLSNDKAVQAVFHKKLDIFQCIFYKSGAVHINDLTITVNKPCALLMKNASGASPVILIADPSQQEKEIMLSVKTKNLQAERLISINMPAGHLAGSSVKIEL
jgi:chondroitin AC lyase